MTGRPVDRRHDTDPSTLIGAPLQDAAHPETYDSNTPPRRRRATMGQAELEQAEEFDPDTGEAL